MAIRFTEWRDQLLLAIEDEETRLGTIVPSAEEVGKKLGHAVPSIWLSKALDQLESDRCLNVWRTSGPTRVQLTGRGLEICEVLRRRDTGTTMQPGSNASPQDIRRQDASADSLGDTLLIELAKRFDQTPAKHGLSPTLSAKVIAQELQMQVSDSELDEVLGNLEQQDLIMRDSPSHDGPDDGFHVHLNPGGYERGNLLQQLREIPLAPASDRYVELNHNSQAYVDAVAALERVVEEVRRDNKYGAEDTDDRDQRLAELDAARTLFKAPRISTKAVLGFVGVTLVYLADKFLDTPIGEAAQMAWTAIKRLVGL